ncbi:hypothetical protein KC19_12G110500 [Ceratodon purpureus]|uniref:Protein kinase domain-containing protein n=1 Tax=Ceratodon purpureus TaxID=3225 RepID=A0A8T0G770_CERPU|nr:hypothetical protein KC19_12G110500 [Ceratodon purpureus]
MAEQEYMHPPSDAGNAGLYEKLEVYTRLVNERCMKAVSKVGSCKFNKKQCAYLAEKLEGLVECSRSFLRATQGHSFGIVEKWVETFKLMLLLSKQIDDFVQSCCKEEWIQSAMTMTNTSEYVSSLGCNVKLCKVACEGFLEKRGGPGSFTAVELQRFTWAKLDEMYRIEVEIVKKKAEEDLVTLSRNVTAELTFLKGERLDVAHYLLQILNEVQGRPTEDQKSLRDSIFKWRVLVDRELGTGATATVYAATWLGIAVAKKVFKGLDNSYFEEEVTNLAPLRHPNITSMFCCKKTNRDSSIIMELMDGDLNKLLHNRGEENNDSSPFPILEAVDIMLQVGEGVNYLHNNRIVHRDLKSDNILVKKVKVEESDYVYFHAKVTDFGISVKKDTTARLTILPQVGTSRYMPPEVIKSTEPNSQKSPSESVKTLSFPFKCDTYSYGMVCYEILTGHVPFHEFEIVSVKKKVKQGDRPKLRDDLPPLLKALIESCWSGDPKKRPKFNLICSQLRYLKYLLMTGADKETHEFAAAEFEAAAGESCREEVAREQQAAAAKSPEEAAVANEMGSPDVVNTFPGATVGSGDAVVKSICGIVQDVPEKIFAMEDHFTRVKSSVLEGRKSDSSSCVCIRGMGGAGKTLLAQMVNNDKEIQQVFGEDSVIWITVGRDAEISVIYDRMRKRLHVCSDGRALKDQRTDLWNAFSKRSILLILDDVWDGIFHECEDMLYWLDIAKGPGSVTLVTTRDESVTRKCVNAGVEIILRLPEEQSWELFCIHAFDTHTAALPKELEELARAVCKECDCLPLALKVIGRAMKGKSEVGEWRKTLRRLRASSIMGDKIVDRQLFERLRFSYDELDDPRKTCFLYFAAFPEDCEVPVEHLCRIWIAEGLFGDQDLDVKAASDEAESAVKELLDRSLIEECTVDWEGRKRVKMHDILRDLAIQMTREGEECERESLFMMERKDLEEFPRTWLGRELKVKRLSLWGNKIKRFPHNFKAPNLKICILYPILWGFSEIEWQYGGCEIEESFFYELHALKFLQICYNFSIKFPESIGGLGSLQHLDLQGCTALEQLPESIGGLGSLQHLDLAHCRALEQLPESIGGLGSLQHLNLAGCVTLEQLPKSIGGLGCLQHLSLERCWALEQLPESIGGLGSLQHLDLEGCEALEQLPESIGGLGSLQHLNLPGCRALKQLPESIGGLGSLQHLNLEGCEALEELPESIGGLGSLQHLNLAHCRALEQLPESIGELGSLQHLDLVGSKVAEQLPEHLVHMDKFKILF